MLKHPFGYPEPVFTDTSTEQANSIHHALEHGDVPWNLKDVSLPSPLSSLIRSCCHTKTSLRPSMAFVAHSLLQLVSSDGVLIEPSEQDPEDVKSRVQEQLGQVEIKPRKQQQVTHVEVNDVDFLRALANDGDPDASALLGAAIWRDLVIHDPEDDSNFISLTPEYQSLGMYLSQWCLR